MIQDCFNKWYGDTYPDLKPELDDMHPELLEAYRAGWKRHMDLDEAMQELCKLSQEEGDYNDL